MRLHTKGIRQEKGKAWVKKKKTQRREMNEGKKQKHDVKEKIRRDKKDGERQETKDKRQHIQERK